MRRVPVGLAAAVALASCSVGRTYERPTLDLPPAYRGDGTAQAQSRTLGELGWWEVFSDPQLHRLLQTALARNRDLGIAAARVAEARALVGQAKTAQLPQLGLALSAARGRTVQSGGYITAGVFNAGADASWEIDFWRRLASLTDAARANLLATEAGRGAVEVGLLSAVATTWFSLLALDREVAITTRAIANRERFVDLTQKMNLLGAASPLDVNRAVASLAQARATLPELQRQIVQTENQLQSLLGDNPAPVARETNDLPPLPDVPPGLPSSLLERRPDLIQAEALLVGATANVNSAKAALFPAIALTANYGSESFSLSKLFSGPTRVWAIGLDLVQPLINAQRNGDVVTAAESRERQALLQYQTAVALAFRDVADAIAARRGYAESLVAADQQVAALREAQTHVTKRYQFGRSSYFEVIDADASLLAAEIQRVQAQRNSLVASVQLYAALGGGWNPAAVTPVPNPAMDTPVARR